MSKKIEQPVKQASELYITLLDQTVRANRIVAKGVERAIEAQFGWIETVIESTRPFITTGQSSDVLTGQMSMMKTLGEKFITTTGKLTEIQRETGAELKDVAVDSIKATHEALPNTA